MVKQVWERMLYNHNDHKVLTHMHMYILLCGKMSFMSRAMQYIHNYVYVHVQDAMTCAPATIVVH